jgi:hypothetical protein
MADAETKFRQTIESLVDELEELADSGTKDYRAALDDIRECYSTAHAAHGCEYVRETLCSTTQDWRTTLEIAGTMARSARTTPRSWLINRVSEQWNKKCQGVTSCYVLIDGLLGPRGHAEAERRTRVRIREIYDEQVAADAHPAPVETVLGPAAPLSSPKAEAPAAASAIAFEPVPAVQRDQPARRSLTTKAVQERRNRLDRFIENCRQARDRKPTYGEIAVASRYKNRSAVYKYLSGEASDACVQNIEEILNMSPHEFERAMQKRRVR